MEGVRKVRGERVEGFIQRSCLEGGSGVLVAARRRDWKGTRGGVLGLGEFGLMRADGSWFSFWCHWASLVYDTGVRYFPTCGLEYWISSTVLSFEGNIEWRAKVYARDRCITYAGRSWWCWSRCWYSFPTKSEHSLRRNYVWSL
jgi:hypothetical protein